MTQISCSFCLEMKTQNCCWRLHMRVTNLHVSILSKCLLPIFLCGSIGREGHTKMSCKYLSRLHHIIVVLCQVLLSSTRNLDFFGLTPVNICCVLSCSRDLFQVYITFYYFYPQLILVQHFANVPSSLDQKEIFRSHFWAFNLH